tara:strand:- start:48 stop:752 length:705 start_codon:yes stop_codon:yes gene_type:complete
METYGDLKKAINAIKLKQKGAKIGDVAIDVALGAIPGIGAAKTTFDFIKAAFLKPDTKKSKTWLDKLDVDDEMSAIVDDTVENGFLKAVAASIEKKSDDEKLDPNFNMDEKMKIYLSDKYKGRTVTGVKENKLNKTMKKSEFKNLIKENILSILKEEETEGVKIPGTLRPLLAKIAPNADIQKVSLILGKISKGKEGTLTRIEKEVLSEIFISLIKIEDTSLLMKFVQVIKQIK